MAKEKNTFIQAIRGICIFAVLLIHCFNGKVYGGSSPYYWYGIIMRQFINFPVSVFVFLAAFYSRPTEYSFNYFKKRFTRLFVPYLVWSLIYVLVDILFLGEKISAFKFLKRIVAGGCQIQLYFIVVLIQMLFITPLTVFLYKKCKKWNYVFFAVTPLYLIASYVLKVKFNTDIPLKTVMFPAWFLFYWLGTYCNINNKEHLFKLKFIPAMIFVALSCIEGIVWGKLELYDMAVSQLKITSCILSVTIINIILVYKDKIYISENNILVYNGNISYGIYYVHMVGIMISQHFATLWGITDLMPLPVIQLFQFIFVLATSIGLIEITKKVIGKDPANKLLGF